MIATPLSPVKVLLSVAFAAVIPVHSATPAFAVATYRLKGISLPETAPYRPVL